MKRVMISMGLVVALSMSAFAQGSDKKEMCEFPCEQMAKELNLSDAQVAKLKAANETFAQEAKAVREKQQQAMQAGKEAMQAAEARRNATLKATLTQEQYIKYLEGKVQHMEHRPGKDMMGDRSHKQGRGMDKQYRRHQADSIGAPRMKHGKR